MKISEKPISEALLRILSKKLFVPEALLTLEYWDEPLTGPVFKLSSIEMTYLFFEIEKTLEIVINPQKLKNYRFNTINKIMDAIQSAISQKGDANM